MSKSRFRVISGALGFVLTGALFVACDPSTSSSVGAAGTPSGGAARLLRVESGRLVDIYAYRRVDSADGRRLNTFNRVPVLVRREVVVDPAIESQPLFDSVGEENNGADYRFLPFDIRTGHEELLILWDDRALPGSVEHERFQGALDRARDNLIEIAASHRNQDVRVRPMPVVPRNAALVLTFDRNLGADRAFFAANPGAVQLLAIQGDPNLIPPPDALFGLPFRILPQGDKLVIDTTILGDEQTAFGASTTGLPVSNDSRTANIRVAIPSRGGITEAFRVERDRIGELNDLDSAGRPSVIRDFRSGNRQDGRAGALLDVEAPMIVGDFEMGIIDVDPQQNVLTINKRFNLVSVRGRMPFVDGAVDATTGLPTGPTSVPTVIPLRSGDILLQEVTSQVTGETVRLRAEILENLAIGTFDGDPLLPELGRAVDGSQAENDAVMRVRVASLQGTDSQGNPVSFEASALPLGADCIVRTHYYEHVASAIGGLPTTDNDPDAVGGSRRPYFVTVDPPPPTLDQNQNPVPLGAKVDPLARVSVRFSEPMDINSVKRLDNFILTTSTFDDEDVGALIKEPKPASLSILDAQLLDLEGDGTLLSLNPRLGFFHLLGEAEQYWLHLMLDGGGITDLAQNTVEVFDTRLDIRPNFSVPFTLDEDALDNLVGSRVFRFESADEDGSTPGSLDVFGQFSLQDGRLLAAPTNRFSLTADNQNLGGILRYTRGECFSSGQGMTVVPANVPGTLYQTPSMVGTGGVAGSPIGTAVGAAVEPHQPRGSRMQLTYREEDFGLAQADPNALALDIEQMYWAPYNDSVVLFDRFDRYSLSLGHANKRPDLRFFLIPGMTPAQDTCNLDCASYNSGLSTNFSSNVLQGTSMVDVVVDRPYEINPNNAFRSSSGVKYVPYPEFERSYTWRDERLITWDPVLRTARGLGGAQEPRGLFPNQDTTASVDSPWGPNRAPSSFDQTVYVLDEGDFWGTRTRDHNPIALPLLMDFQVFPENGSFPVAKGVNAFHMALVGPTAFATNAGVGGGGGDGYYNSSADPTCFGLNYPIFRIHRTGGFDQNTGQDILIDPDTTVAATSSWIKDPALGDPTFGLFQAPAGDDHVYWTQADFVRRVSIVTFGFFDTLLPNQHGLAIFDPPLSDWPGISDSNGIPDFESAQARFGTLRAADLVSSFDPPLVDQPAGTNVRVEFRAIDEFPTASNAQLYNPATDDNVRTRGSLLNANYACEAFRYAMPNSGPAGDTARVQVEGLTPYVDERQLGTIRNRFGLLPRYLNFRLILQNNVDATPATSPSLEAFAISFRMRPNN